MLTLQVPSTTLALLLIGYSLFSALVLGLTAVRRMGWLLLLALAGLQASHLAWLYFDAAWVHSIPYQMTLFAVAPAFFLYSHPLLNPTASIHPIAHAIPVGLAALLPHSVALPLAFGVGGLYLLWLAHDIYGLRQERRQFRREIALLSGVFCIALGVAGLGMVQALLPDKLFFVLYAIAIGIAFVLVQITLGLRPQLPTEVIETAQNTRASYTHSTLTQVDCDTALLRLQTLMGEERLYTDTELSLPRLAERMDLSTHQLSELLNTRLGKSFSRYLREQRVTAAKAMLVAESSASVLSVGLNVGFSTQSNFYEAFRELEGMTPGQYRKLSLRS